MYTSARLFWMFDVGRISMTDPRSLTYRAVVARVQITVEHQHAIFCVNRVFVVTHNCWLKKLALLEAS